MGHAERRRSRRDSRVREPRTSSACGSKELPSGQRLLPVPGQAREITADGRKVKSAPPIRARPPVQRKLTTSALVLVSSAAVADSATHTYMLELEASNFGSAPNGDVVEITGHADLSVNPKSAAGSGTFTHTRNGTIVGSGTWMATRLLDYQSYCCGVVLGDPSLPDDFCGGKVKLRVTLITPLGQLPATMTVICIIGPNPPDSAFGAIRSEGAMLDVPGIVNFNHTAGGDNVIMQTS
jgi:hypothetical protein